jgi:ketosteroid isomerase-like protein
MTEEPTAYDRLERTRLAFGAWNRGDVTATLEDFAPHAGWEALPQGQSFEGVTSAVERAKEKAEKADTENEPVERHADAKAAQNVVDSVSKEAAEAVA